MICLSLFLHTRCSLADNPEVEASFESFRKKEGTVVAESDEGKTRCDRSPEGLGCGAGEWNCGG